MTTSKTTKTTYRLALQHGKERIYCGHSHRTALAAGRCRIDRRLAGSRYHRHIGADAGVNVVAILPSGRRRSMNLRELEALERRLWGA